MPAETRTASRISSTCCHERSGVQPYTTRRNEFEPMSMTAVRRTGAMMPVAGRRAACDRLRRRLTGRARGVRSGTVEAPTRPTLNRVADATAWPAARRRTPEEPEPPALAVSQERAYRGSIADRGGPDAAP